MTFDFGGAGRLSEDKLSFLPEVLKVFLQELSSNLSLYLRCYASGTVAGVEQTSYPAEENRHGAMLYLSMAPYDGHAVVEISPEVLWPVLDLILGGDGIVNDPPAREMTSVEKDLLDGFVRILAQCLTEAWTAPIPVQFEAVSLETASQNTRRTGKTDQVVVSALEMRLGEASGLLRLLVPSLAIHAMSQSSKSSVERTGPSPSSGAILQRLAHELLIDVDCELRGSTMRLRDLLQLKAGGVVDLGLVCDGAVSVCANGIPKFKGWLSQAGTRMTVTIE
jgi:flagellar motor switch protein FliM